eukprot:7989251-Pyramimonas_sp.AAC.1
MVLDGNAIAYRVADWLKVVRAFSFPLVILVEQPMSSRFFAFPPIVREMGLDLDEQTRRRAIVKSKRAFALHH